jgi:hypothetical protein
MTPSLDPDLLDRILARCTRDEALALETALLPAWEIRARRLARRDALLRGAAAMLGGSARSAAEAVAAATRGTRRGSWPLSFGSLMQRAVALNGGRSIAWRQVATIIAAGRVEDSVQKSARAIAHGDRDSGDMEKHHP